MNPFEQQLFRDLSFFCDDGAFPGVGPMRPLSILSYKAMQMMELRLFRKSEAEQDIAERKKEIRVWLWLHTAPLAEVCAALWDGTWRGILESNAEVGDIIVQQFAQWHVRVMSMLDASEVDIRARPKPKSDDTPRDVIPPAGLAFMVSMICHHSHADREYVKWQLFLPEALQEYHVAMRWNGHWTVRKGSQLVKLEDLGDLVPDFLKGIITIDSPQA